jgi:deoxyribodipyrimidine photolyase-related protein
VQTVWILGDQLNRGISSLRGVGPTDGRILMVESEAKIASKAWHRQRLHLVLTSMRRFARELEEEGFEVDFVRAPSLAGGLARHRRRYAPDGIRAMEPMSWAGQRLLERLRVERVRSNQFLCHYDEFADWAKGQKRLRMEDFYRWQRLRHGFLMDGEEPAGGRWNFDAENREPPPGPEFSWRPPPRSKLDRVDAEVMESLPDRVVGAPPDGTWATSRRGALTRLRHFVVHQLPRFGPHQDAMTKRSWHLAHALLSPYLNLGLLHPEEVCRAAERAYGEGRVPIASAEGFVRQVLGWREFVWGVYWLHMPGYRRQNALKARRPLPPCFSDSGRTRMACVAEAVRGVEERGYAHHIQRLMVLGNLGLLAGIRPAELVDWMWRSFIDGAEWVMLPNALSMALYADGGRMTTKPYAAGGGYISRMSDSCAGCVYDPKKRTGDDACPFTTLYWDFVARHRERLSKNHRVARVVRGLDRLKDLEEIRSRARSVLRGLGRGEL